MNATFTRLIPLLVCEDIQSTHDFLVSAFGFLSGGVIHGDDGAPVHGEVTVGDATIWLHRTVPDLQLASPKDLPVATGGLVVHVGDVDAHYAYARAAGAEITRDPIDQEYGQREYEARDPEGRRWWFATPLT
jgi:uncharacterized glyoxalase superfamily protein PhnB